MNALVSLQLLAICQVPLVSSETGKILGSTGTISNFQNNSMKLKTHGLLTVYR